MPDIAALRRSFSGCDLAPSDAELEQLLAPYPASMAEQALRFLLSRNEQVTLAMVKLRIGAVATQASEDAQWYTPATLSEESRWLDVIAFRLTAPAEHPVHHIDGSCAMPLTFLRSLERAIHDHPLDGQPAKAYVRLAAVPRERLKLRVLRGGAPS